MFPHSGLAPWARREGPSLAQRGYPGIHAGMPTAQGLRSAIVVNGASKIKVQSKSNGKSKSESESERAR
ncbi:nucleoid-structuring protein H-NS [Pseudomonas sp. D2-30]|uniref:nucleoid-structuring protein H-NS n=1 Tax=unclassified Pseudomonas TaxID=196821 RepID=UPI003DA81FBD